MIHLNISPAYEADIEPSLLEQAATAALRHQGASRDAELAIVIENDEKLHELNREYLGEDHPTDVLSFAADEVDPETGNHYLGDILISYPRAAAQAQAAGHPVESELQLLVVHGVLHLLGHDHLHEEEKAVMWAAQNEILTSLGTRLSRFPD